VYYDHCQISKVVGLAEMSRFWRCIVLLEEIVFSFQLCYHLVKPELGRRGDQILLSFGRVCSGISLLLLC
jgi:hypothetical protein